MTDFAQEYQERLAEVSEKEDAYQDALAQRCNLGVKLEDWDRLLASLPSQVIEVRDYILCSFPGYGQDYVLERIAILARGYNVQGTMEKLNAIETALVAEIELEAAHDVLDSFVRRMPAVIRKVLVDGQGSLF